MSACPHDVNEDIQNPVTHDILRNIIQLLDTTTHHGPVIDIKQLMAGISRLLGMGTTQVIPKKGIIITNVCGTFNIIHPVCIVL